MDWKFDDQIISSGSFSTVRLCSRSDSKDSPKAIAKTTKIQRQRRNSILHVYREVAALLVASSVSCGHVIEILDFIETPEELHVILEYDESAQELLEYLQQHAPLPLTEVSHLSRQLFEALDHLHSSNIIHRDVKLENILISSASKQQHLTLIDFNLASFYSLGRGPLTEPVGTVEYQSPHALREYDSGYVLGEPYNDVWAAGVCVFAMLTSRLPFVGSTPAQVYKSIQNLPQILKLVQDDKARDFLETVFDFASKPTASSLLHHPFLATGSDTPETVASSLPLFSTPRKRQRRPSVVTPLSLPKNDLEISELISSDSQKQMEALTKIITPRLNRRRLDLGSPVNSPLMSSSSFSTAYEPHARRVSFQVFDSQDTVEIEQSPNVVVVDEDWMESLRKSAQRSYSSGSLFQIE